MTPTMFLWLIWCVLVVNVLIRVRSFYSAYKSVKPLRRASRQLGMRAPNVLRLVDDKDLLALVGLTVATALLMIN